MRHLRLGVTAICATHLVNGNDFTVGALNPLELLDEVPVLALRNHLNPD
jgi:hypothetical protein